MATIKDVAKAAGVSVSAVSKYLRTPNNMREDTRTRIAEAIDALEYRPSPLARGLRTGNSGIVAVMIPEIDNPYFSTIFSYLQSGCINIGLIPVLLRNSSPEDLRRAVTLLRSGIISAALCYDDGQAELAISAAKLSIPVVRWSADAHMSSPNTVYIDLQSGFTELCRHLEQIGVREVAYIGPRDGVSASWKYAAVEAYCRDESHALRLRDDGVFDRGYGYQSGFEACGEMLRSLSVLPQAIICEEDMVAVGVLKQLVHNGLNVPEDVYLSGCDDSDLSMMSNPSITSVQFPLKAMCAKALDMMSALMRGEEAPSATFHTSLVIRTSTTPKRR